MFITSVISFSFSIGGGELFDRVIEDEFVLTEKACVAFMKQIIQGVEFMHAEQIIHLDLKVKHHHIAIFPPAALPFLNAGKASPFFNRSIFSFELCSLLTETITYLVSHIYIATRLFSH